MNNEKIRNYSLVNKTYKKLVLPDIASRVCVIIVTLLDSFLAARFIGEYAIAAVALAMPIIIFSNFLHDICASGTMRVMIKYKSRGQAEQAARAWGVIIFNTIACFVIVFAVVLFLLKYILAFFTKDVELISYSLEYIVPTVIFIPVGECGLVIERGLKTDGKPAFFAVRPIISVVLKIILSLLVVLVFDGGLFGLAVASIIASILGYFWSLSYLFNKDCSTKPSFNAVFRKQEMKVYLKEQYEIGSVYALDDGLLCAATTLLNKAYILSGGTIGFTVIGICDAVNTILASVNGAVEATSFNICGVLHANRDYKGFRNAFRHSAHFEIITDIVYILVVGLLSSLVCRIYGISEAASVHMLKVALIMTAVTMAADCFTNLFSSVSLTSGKPKLAKFCAVSHNAVIFITALVGLCGAGFIKMLVIYLVVSCVVVSFEAVLIIKEVNRLKMSEKDEYISFSYILEDSKPADVSSTVGEILLSLPSQSGNANRMALLVEECNRLIQYVNRANRKQVNLDLFVLPGDSDCLITIIDNGVVFDPVHRLMEDNLTEEYALSRMILTSLSPEASYSRMIELNVSHLILSNVMEDGGNT